MNIKSFEDLSVWQMSMDLIVEIYELIKLLPKEENYALSDQMRRSAVSIASNIAEGQQRDSIKEYIHFLAISRGSCGELYTHLLICRRLNYLTDERISHSIDLNKRIGRMLSSLIQSLKQQSNL